VKVGDNIIVTGVLTPGIYESLIGKILQIVDIDRILPHYYPYKVCYNSRMFWVEGVAHSSLMEALC
jgi:hypothetical protein